MARATIPRVCVDRILPQELATRSRRIARASETGPGPGAMRMAVPLDKPWEPGRTLTVAFLGSGEPDLHGPIEDVAHRWSDQANISLDFGRHDDADIRITFANSGSWSYLGKDALRRPSAEATMNYGWLDPDDEDEIRRVVLHEFGHALGAIHEHQHPEVAIPWDVDAVYEYYGGPPNLWDRSTVDTNIFEAYSSERTNFSAYDPDSIMHYPVDNELTVGDYEREWRDDLSATDIEFIGTQYPSDPKRPLELTVGAEVPQSIGEHGEEDTFDVRIDRIDSYAIETSGDADLVIALFGPDDRDSRIATDDDSGRDLNARIETELAPGQYWLRVWHYWPRATGDYSVSLRHANSK